MVSTPVLTCAAENQDEVRYRAQLRKAAVVSFQACIERAISEGEFKPAKDSGTLARYLGTVVQGMSIQAQDGATQSQLLAVAGLAIRTLRQFAA